MTETTLPRILHICKVYLPVRGGIQKVVHNIISLLTQYSHSVTTTGEDGSIRFEKIGRAEVSRCRSYGQIASMPVAPSIIKKIAMQARQYQLIAIHYPFPLAELALLFVFWAPPLVVHWHSDIVAQKRLKWLVAPLTWLMLLRARAIVVTSKNMLLRSGFLRRFQRKIVYVPYGLSDSLPVPRHSTSADEYFLIVGRHVSYKGIDVAIRAVRHNSLQLVIAGDGPLFEQHEKLAVESGAQKQVKFVRHASDADVVDLLANCSALVVPSVSESEAFALVQLEAMRLGKAIINTRLESSVPWVARHQQEALTVPPRDVEALSAAMQELHQNPARAGQLGKQGLQRYKQQFSTDSFAAAINDLYGDILTSGRRRPVTGQTELSK